MEKKHARLVKKSAVFLKVCGLENARFSSIVTEGGVAFSTNFMVESSPVQTVKRLKTVLGGWSKEKQYYKFLIHLPNGKTGCVYVRDMWHYGRGELVTMVTIKKSVDESPAKDLTLIAI